MFPSKFKRGFYCKSLRKVKFRSLGLKWDSQYFHFANISVPGSGFSSCLAPLCLTSASATFWDGRASFAIEMAAAVTLCFHLTPPAASPPLSKPAVACSWCGISLESSTCVRARVHICAHPFLDSAYKICILWCSSGGGTVLSHCQGEALNLKGEWAGSTQRPEPSLWHRSPQKTWMWL